METTNAIQGAVHPIETLEQISVTSGNNGSRCQRRLSMNECYVALARYAARSGSRCNVRGGGVSNLGRKLVRRARS